MITLRHSNRINRKKMKPSISKAETRVVERLRKGKTHKEIAEELFLAKTTVDTHVVHAQKKLRAKNSNELVNNYLHSKYSFIDF